MPVLVQVWLWENSGYRTEALARSSSFIKTLLRNIKVSKEFTCNSQISAALGSLLPLWPAWLVIQLGARKAAWPQHRSPCMGSQDGGPCRRSRGTRASSAPPVARPQQKAFGDVGLTGKFWSKTLRIPALLQKSWERGSQGLSSQAVQLQGRLSVPGGSPGVSSCSHRWLSPVTKLQVHHC